MSWPVFKLEEYLSKYEFKAPYLLCCSDAESITMADLLCMADKESLALWSNLKLSYTESAGLPLLNEEIAKLYNGLSSDNVRCFAGAEDGIFSLFHAVLSPGDHVVVTTPAYQSLVTLPEKIGCDVTKLELSPKFNWSFNVADYEKLLRPNTKMVVINTPHNPTGSIASRDFILELTKLLAPKGIYLFSDEVYAELGMTGEFPYASAIYDKAFSLGVMSKAYGLAGLRIGWIASQSRDYLLKAERIKHYTSICNSAPSEILSLIALRARKKIIARNNQIVEKNLKLFDEFMLEYEHKLTWVKPKASCVGFVKYHGIDSTDELAKKLVEKEGVLIMPGSIYDYDRQHFRVGFGRSNFAEGLLRFDRFLKTI